MKVHVNLCCCTICGKEFKFRSYKSNFFCGLDCYRKAQKSGFFKRGPKSTTHRQPCGYCGKTVIKIPSKDRRGNRCGKVFCDRACYDKFRIVDRQCCKSCGKQVPAGMGKKAKYCSWECRLEGRRAKPKRCLNCKCLFTPIKPIKRPDGIHFVSHNSGKTCSSECQIEWIRSNPVRKQKISKAFKGDNHPNWQGGKSRINDVSNRGRNWKTQRKKALERDSYRCLKCGIDDDSCLNKYSRRLDVDHIEPFHNFRNSRQANVLSNLQTLCASCHRKEEHRKSVAFQMVLPFQRNRKTRHNGTRN